MFTRPQSECHFLPCTRRIINCTKLHPSRISDPNVLMRKSIPAPALLPYWNDRVLTRLSCSQPLANKRSHANKGNNPCWQQVPSRHSPLSSQPHIDELLAHAFPFIVLFCSLITRGKRKFYFRFMQTIV